MVNMKKIILNQKSYLMYDEMVEFKKEFDKFKLKNSEFILFPPVHYLALFKDSCIAKNISSTSCFVKS